jgi:hypothetical protein
MRIVVAPLASRFNHPYRALYGYIIARHHVQHTEILETVVGFQPPQLDFLQIH